MNDDSKSMRNHASISHFINMLEDRTAIYILRSIAKSRHKQEEIDIFSNDQIGRKLAEVFGLSLEIDGGKEITEGELSKLALIFLAQDNDTYTIIRKMAENPVQNQFDYLTPLAITTAIFIILQLHIKIERQNDGKWSILVEKKYTKDPILKPLIQKLVQYLSQI